ncbi:hypothetical protein F5879DRAFT_300529 [Lentinula edodes]|nr:hypothetical protein F5879DRAFT_300529 [Lentinula edodes]
MPKILQTINFVLHRILRLHVVFLTQRVLTFIFLVLYVVCARNTLTLFLASLEQSHVPFFPTYDDGYSVYCSLLSFGYISMICAFILELGCIDGFDDIYHIPPFRGLFYCVVSCRPCALELYARVVNFQLMHR